MRGKGQRRQRAFSPAGFFFFNFAYKGDYEAISYRSDNRVTIREGECYIGQPYAGYAIRGSSDDQLIIGILIRTSTFFKTFFSALSSDAALFRFFLTPQTEAFSDEYIHLRFSDDAPVRTLLEMMVAEYASKRPDTQSILKPLTLTLFMLVARQHAMDAPAVPAEKLSDRLVEYIGTHAESVTLGELAAQFSYHPNYISNLLRRETGRSFSELLLEQRMEQAASLIKGTSLSVEEIAALTGYGNTSNFYKAFRKHFGTSPRDHAL